jgi:hypothetical protein
MKTTLLSDFLGAGAVSRLVLQDELLDLGVGSTIDFCKLVTHLAAALSMEP